MLALHSDSIGGTHAVVKDKRWRSTGPADNTLSHEITFCIDTNTDWMDEELAAITDKTSPRFRQYLDRETVGQRLQNDVATTAVKSFLQAAGCEVTRVTAYGEYVTATAPVATWNSMLSATFEVFEKTPSNASATTATTATPWTVVRAANATVPPAIAGHVRMLRGATALPVEALKSSSTIIDEALSEALQPVFAYPTFLRSLYGIPDTTKLDVDMLPIAVYEMGSYGLFNNSDLATFQRHNDLPVQALVDVNGGGQTACLSTGTQCLEANLDIQTISGVATGSSIEVYYYSTEDAYTAYTQLLDQALANSSFPKVLSSSWYILEEDLQSDQLDDLCHSVKTLSLLGHTFVGASGDYGAHYATDTEVEYFRPQFPASCPYTLAVGATTVWNGVETAQMNGDLASSITSGGGFSTHYDAPSFQFSAVQAYNSSGTFMPAQFLPDDVVNMSKRGYPDIAALGHLYPIYVGGQEQLEDGTSASAPLVASMLTILNSMLAASNQQPIGFLNTALYTENAGLIATDITRGNNNCLKGGCCGSSLSVCANVGYFTSNGWDPVTGWGTLQFNNLSYFVGAQNATLPAQLTTCASLGISDSLHCADECLLYNFYGSSSFSDVTGKATCMCSNANSILVTLCSDFDSTGFIVGVTLTILVIVVAVIIAVIFVQRRRAQQRNSGGLAYQAYNGGEA